VQNLTDYVMADLNSDGTPDAYWNNNLTCGAWTTLEA
jgi:hypothetical protein